MTDQQPIGLVTGHDALFALPPGQYFESSQLGTRPDLYLHDCILGLVQTVRVTIFRTSFEQEHLLGLTGTIEVVECTCENWWVCRIRRDNPRVPNERTISAIVLRYASVEEPDEPDIVVAKLLDPPERYRYRRSE